MTTELNQAEDLLHQEMTLPSHKITGFGRRLFGGRGIDVGSIRVNMRPAYYPVRISHGRFRPSPTGRGAMVIAEVVDGKMIDLAAFDGWSVATRLGRAAILGQSYLDNEYQGLEPLRIFRDPLDWIMAERKGIVIVDPSIAAHTLINFLNLEVDDDDHISEIFGILQSRQPTFEVASDQNLKIEMRYAI